ncbi:ThuA domain-containing protein [Candidatus Poribacteria bacterium]
MSESRILILANNDQYHPLETLADMMEGWLKDSGMKDVTLSKDRSVISGNLNEYDLLILAMTPSDLSAADEDALVSFVADGKKLMGIHSATVVDAENEKYIEMIGGRFVHHDPHGEFTVKIADPGHPVVAGLDDFEIADELYVLDRTPSAASVLLTAVWKDEAQPMLYIRAHGRGKVLYNALGHGPAAYENPNLKKLVIQGAKWLLS